MTTVVSGELAELAEFVSGCRLDEIPDPVLDHARGLILDQLGVCLTGARQTGYWDLAEAVSGLGLASAGPALVLAPGAPRRGPYAAALLNAAASHLSELGEGVSRAVVHVSNAVVPAALAYADTHPVTGSQLLRAVALGCETLIRFGIAVNQPPDTPTDAGDIAAAYLRGWWTPIMLSPVGAATAWVLLGGGGSRELREAWSTALNVGPATGVAFVLGGAPTKGLGMGLGCASGIAAAEVALRQTRDEPAPVAGEPTGEPGYDPVTGWMPLLGSPPNPAAFTRELGRAWELDYPLYKYIATVGPLHAAVEAVFDLVEAHPIAPAEVVDVLVEGYQRTVQFLGRPHPRTAEEAKTSLAHTLAVALVTRDRRAMLHDAFEPVVRTDPEVGRIAGLVRAVREPTFHAEYPRRSSKSRVTITTRDGQQYRAEVDRDALPRYHRPSREDLTGKLVAATGHLFAEADARRLAERCWAIEELSRAGDLTDQLAGLLAEQTGEAER